MGNLTVVRNPFDKYNGRVYTPVLEGANLLDLVEKYANDDFEIVVSFNGKIIDDYDRVIRQGDTVSIMAAIKSGGGGGGGGKEILRTVAMIAVIAVSAYVTAGATLTTGSKFLATAGSFGAYAGGAAVAIGGGLLVNALLPPAQPQLGNYENKTDSNTYGWGLSQNQINEGNSCSVLFGKHKIYPQVIGQYKKYYSYKDHINVLMHICDGKIDNVTDVKINDIPIAELGDNATFSFKDGSINQSVSERFGDTISEKNVNYELVEKDDEIIVTTDGNQVERLAVGIVIPNGVFTFSNGNYSEFRARYSIHYRVAGSGGLWNPIVTNDPEDGMEQDFTGKTRDVVKYIYNSSTRRRERTVIQEADTFDTAGFTIYGNSPDTIRVIHEHFANLSPNQYEIRIKRLEKFPDTEGSTARSSKIFAGFIQEIVRDDFQYPGRALFEIGAVAQEKIYGGSPRISCVAHKDNIEVYSGDWGVGTPTLKAGNSPAWACYEMLTHPLFGAGIHPSKINMQDFNDWHDFCVAEGLEVNIYIDQASNMFDAMNKISLLGRGSIIQRGTEFGAIWDDVSPMVHLFTMGNIISESVNMSYLEKTNRANTAEVTFYDETLDYERRTLIAKLDETSALDDERKATIDLQGCINRQQALDYARFVLRSNKHLIRTVTFDAEIDAVPVQPGDVFGFSHDIPLWGQSGRIVSATSNTITLDGPVAVETGKSYNIVVRHDDDSIETQAITNEGTGDYTTLTLDGTWSVQPDRPDLYTFGEVNKETKLFRCTSVQRTQDLQVRVTGLEYRAEVYVNDPTPLPDYEPEGLTDELVGLTVDDNYKILPDGTIQGRIDLNWQGFALYWDVAVFEKNTLYTRPEWNGRVEQSRFAAIGIRPDIEYTVRVISPNGTTIEQDYTPIIDMPETVIGLTAGQIDNFVTLDWQVPTSEIPVYKYEVKRGNDYVGSTEIGLVDETFMSFYEPAAGTYTYWVTPLTESGFIGQPESVTIEVDTPPDFKAIAEFCVDGSGTHTNTYWNGAGVVGPVDLNTTWGEWWDSTPYATWQDFIDAGYGDVYYTPNTGGAVSSGEYEQVFDVGTVIGQATISFQPNRVNISENGSSVDIQYEYSYSQDGITYSDPTNLLTVRAEDFRYVKVKSIYSSDSIELASTRHCITISAKRVQEFGDGTITNATNGLVVNFDFPYYDVEGIQVTPISTSFRSAVYDFTDVPNPTSFTVYLFDENGNKVTGNFVYAVVGI